MRKAVDAMSRVPYKLKTVIERKWKEKDKKTLLDRVRDKFFLLRKMRINIIRIDPNKKRKRRSQNSSKQRIKAKRQKITEFTEAKIGNEFASIDNESSVISSNAYSKVGETKEVYYKLANP